MMEHKKIIIGIIVASATLVGILVVQNNGEKPEQADKLVSENTQSTNEPEPIVDKFSILALKAKEYPGSEIEIEQDLGEKGGFHSYIISYQSEGLKLRALMNVPTGDKPVDGWPVLILNHGFIPPATYSTIASYKAFTDFYSRNGFLLLKPDYRGHDDSEGQASSGHTSPDYVTDVLNLVSSIKQYNDADPANILMWGHSMGGSITLRSLVISKDIKAGVLFAGVVASPQQMFAYAQANKNSKSIPGYVVNSSEQLLETYGSPTDNPDAWNAISPYSYLDDITVPVSVHHGTADASVPIVFSEEIVAALKDKGKDVEYFVYPNADHNIANTGRSLLLSRTLSFLNMNVK